MLSEEIHITYYKTEVQLWSDLLKATQKATQNRGKSQIFQIRVCYSIYAASSFFPCSAHLLWIVK